MNRETVGAPAEDHRPGGAFVRLSTPILGQLDRAGRSCPAHDAAANWGCTQVKHGSRWSSGSGSSLLHAGIVLIAAVVPTATGTGGNRDDPTIWFTDGSPNDSKWNRDANWDQGEWPVSTDLVYVTTSHHVGSDLAAVGPAADFLS